MEILIWVLGIAWLIASAVNKKKRRQAQAEAAQKQAQEAANASAPQPQSPVPAQRTVLDAPVSQAQSKAFDPYFIDVPERATPVAAHAQTAQRGAIESTLESRTLHAPQTRTREAVGAKVRASSETRHTLEASSLSRGHAHTESSLTGISENCPPEQLPNMAATRPQNNAPSPAPAAIPFSWEVSEVARGLVLAEILGKPKALQKRA